MRSVDFLLPSGVHLVADKIALLNGSIPGNAHGGVLVVNHGHGFTVAVTRRQLQLGRGHLHPSARVGHKEPIYSDGNRQCYFAFL